MFWSSRGGAVTLVTRWVKHEEICNSCLSALALRADGVFACRVSSDRSGAGRNVVHADAAACRSRAVSHRRGGLDPAGARRRRWTTPARATRARWSSGATGTSCSRNTGMTPRSTRRWLTGFTPVLVALAVGAAMNDALMHEPRRAAANYIAGLGDDRGKTSRCASCWRADRAELSVPAIDRSLALALERVTTQPYQTLAGRAASGSPLGAGDLAVP